MTATVLWFLRTPRYFSSQEPIVRTMGDLLWNLPYAFLIDQANANVIITDRTYTLVANSTYEVHGMFFVKFQHFTL